MPKTACGVCSSHTSIQFCLGAFSGWWRLNMAVRVPSSTSTMERKLDFICRQGVNRTLDTRIFSPATYREPVGTQRHLWVFPKPFLSSPSPKKTKVTASYPSVRARYGQRQRGSTKKESDADENARWRRHSGLGGFDSGANPED